MKVLIAYIMKRHRIQNLSQLATRLGVSHATIKRWLEGGDKPNVESCRKLAEFSGCPIDYIITLAYGE